MNTLTFYSNYYNHHQKALCDAFHELLQDGFTFVETMPMEDFRSGMGWGIDAPSYVLRTYESEENEKRALDLACSSDLVIMGTAPEYYIEKRIELGLIIFRYSERPLKEGFVKFLIPRLTKKYMHLHVRNRKKNMYVLAASAFTAWDFKKMLGSYPGKCYKFAYFPKHPDIDPDEMFRRKEEKAAQAGATTIPWEGRMIRLKRADLLIRAVAILVSKGYDMRVKLIGDGDEKKNLIALSQKLGLNDIVSFEGFLAPDEARQRMADAKIYVCTSNFLEGWGSVIYEALGVGCAVVASHACGATPWLVKPGETGFVYKSGDAASLADKIERLLKDEKLRSDLGKNAYEQMHREWNPEVAAKRVIELCECLTAGKPTPFSDGPCSKAEILKNNWYSDAR